MQSFFTEKNMPLKNLIACATDGAHSMTGRYRGFIGHTKMQNDWWQNDWVDDFMKHCLRVVKIIHGRHLVAKGLGG